MEQKVILIDLPLANEIDFKLHYEGNSTVKNSIEESAFWTHA